MTTFVSFAPVSQFKVAFGNIICFIMSRVFRWMSLLSVGLDVFSLVLDFASVPEPHSVSFSKFALGSRLF